MFRTVASKPKCVAVWCNKLPAVDLADLPCSKDWERRAIKRRWAIPSQKASPEKSVVSNISLTNNQKVRGQP